jgi:hypothetical protein
LKNSLFLFLFWKKCVCKMSMIEYFSGIMFLAYCWAYCSN